MTSGRWLELAAGVYARRYAELDLTVGLVVGEERALVIDTRGDGRQGAELAAAVRTVTRLPLSVVITHAHFDHCFGTAAFLPPPTGNIPPVVNAPPIYAQRGCAGWLRATAETQREQWTAHYRARGDEATAEALAAAEVVEPNSPVDYAAELDLGGRVARLLHPGAGHTDHDLTVHVPDAKVLFAGDLVEQGGPPDFGDADPARWPETLGVLLALVPEVVVPGHGDPVSSSFMATQRAALTTVAELCLAVTDGRLTSKDAEDLSPYPVDTIRTALSRVTHR